MNIKEVRRKIKAAIGEYEELLTNNKVVWLHLKVFWFSKDFFDRAQ